MIAELVQAQKETDRQKNETDFTRSETAAKGLWRLTVVCRYCFRIHGSRVGKKHLWFEEGR
jgi:hypothetical protein